ncbi:MAG: class II aldolase/adducin family protein [Cohaesibacteraceae bacterium]|nr:class II aldolase/adducin family protein [Cohaesibacteraceae bacterium]
MQNLDVSKSIIDHCLLMNDSGLNQGTSGNISVRQGANMLITPSALAYELMKPEDIVLMPINDNFDLSRLKRKPSSEWRFHAAILAARPEVNAIVHTHSPYATSLAMVRKSIPACHYMIAVFGGNDVRCSDYAIVGSPALAETALDALKDRFGCLLANHGMIALGETLEKAMWRAAELETLARQYCIALSVGEPALLNETEMEEMHALMSSYGLQSTSEE